MNSKTRALLIGLIAVSINLGACSNPIAADSQKPMESQSPATVTVSKRDIRPIVSQSGAVENLSPYVVMAPKAGRVERIVNVGDTVKKGDRLAVVSNIDIVAPTDGRITKAVPHGVSVPASFSLVTVESESFSISVQAKLIEHQFSASSHFLGRYQIEGGAGPANCEAVVFAEEPRESSGNEGSTKALSSSTPGRASSTLQCVIPRNENAFPGGIATSVISARTRQQVLALPVEAVAGRENHGEVNVHRGGETQRVSVVLGVNDGAWIEVISGVKEGEQVDSLAPKLDPLGKQ
ncbi:hypothetical protein ACTOV0_00230 [Arcanobacterium canis]